MQAAQTGSYAYDARHWLNDELQIGANKLNTIRADFKGDIAA
jgi:hypothetical protein